MENTNLTLNDLHFSTRTLNVLKLKNINTISDLCNITERELSRYRGCGRKTLNEILWVLKDLGLHLKRDDTVNNVLFKNYDSFISDNWKYACDSNILSNGYDIFINDYQINIDILCDLLNPVDFEIFMFRSLNKFSYTNLGDILDKSGNRISQLYKKTIKTIKLNYFIRFLFLNTIKEHYHEFDKKDASILNLFRKRSNFYNSDKSNFWNVCKITSSKKDLYKKLNYNSILTFYINYLDEIYPSKWNKLKDTRIEYITDIYEYKHNILEELTEYTLDSELLEYDDLEYDDLEYDDLDDLFYDDIFEEDL